MKLSPEAGPIYKESSLRGRSLESLPDGLERLSHAALTADARRPRPAPLSLGDSSKGRKQPRADEDRQARH
jgi:hypothetical protein